MLFALSCFTHLEYNFILFEKQIISKLRFLILEKYLGIILPFRCPGETLKCEIFRERFFKKLKLAHLTFDKNWFPNRYFRNRIIYTKKNLEANSDFQLSRGNAKMWKLLLKCFWRSLALPIWNIIWFYFTKKIICKVRFLMLKKNQE